MYHSSYSTILEMLQLLKFFHGIGLYDSFCHITALTEDDYYELVQLGLENIAPIYIESQISSGDDGDVVIEEGDDCDDYGWHCHTLHMFSSPEMQEYYRLCRIYEYKHGLSPKENRFVTAAERHYCNCLNCVSGNFGGSFDDDRHTTKLYIEVCPESDWAAIDLIYCIHETLEFYSENLSGLRLELLKGEPVFLMQLPSPKGEL